MAQNSFKINDSINLRPLATPPTNPQSGDIYNDSTLGFQAYFNGAWGPLGSVGSLNINTDWTTYTPTFAGIGTPTSVSVFYRRNGDTIEIQGTFFTGTTSASAFTLSLPTGLVVDTTKMSSAASGSFVGSIYNTQNTQIAYGTGVGMLFFDGSDTSNIYGAKDAATTTFNKDSGAGLFDSNALTTFYLAVPIAGWSATVQTQSYSNVTNWNTGLTFTPVNFGTPQFQSWETRRVGDTMQVRGYFEASNVVASPAQLTMPLGYSIDASKFQNLTALNVHRVGIYSSAPTTGSINIFSGNGAGIMFYDGSDTNNLYFALDETGGSLNKDNASTVASGDNNTVMHFEFEVPITGWAAQSPGVSVGASAYLSTNASIAQYANLICDAKFFDTTSSYNPTTGVFTVPVPGIYEVSASSLLAGGSGGGNFYLVKNATPISYMTTLSATSVQSGTATVQCSVGDTLSVSLDNPVTVNGGTSGAGAYITSVSFILKEGIPSAADVKATPAVSASTGAFGVVGGPSDTGISCSVINSSSGRVWAIKMQSDGSGNASFFGIGGGGAPESWAIAYIYRNNNGGGPVLIANYQVLNYQGTAGGYNYTPSSSISFEDINPPIGTNVYTISVGSTSSGGATGEGFLQYAVMVVRQVQ